MKFNLKNTSWIAGLILLLAACGNEDDTETPDRQEDTGVEDTGTRPDITRDSGSEEVGETDTRETSEPDVETDTDVDTNIEDEPEPGFCGNNVAEDLEQCDGADRNDQTCQELGYLDGTLACDDRCLFVTDGCYNSWCPDGSVDDEEQCDGGNLAEQTCESLGFLEGELSCSDECTFNTIACIDAICDDDQITGSEMCDGDRFGEATCVTEGFAPGGDGFLTCDDCQIDTSNCDLSVCGNDIRESEHESCDGDDFGEDTCRVRGFWGGPLSCNETCDEVDETSCVPNVCGNGTIEGDEVCDVGILTESCTDHESDTDIFFVGGLLGCSDDCLNVVTDECLISLDDIVDSDGDLIPDDVDVCPNIEDPLQLDYDLDGEGNACDEDFFTWHLLEPGTLLSATVNVEPRLGDTSFPTEVEIPVLDASFSLRFDAEGLLEVRIDSITFGTASFSVATTSILGEGPTITGTVTPTLHGETSFQVPGTFDDYLIGEISGENPSFDFSSNETIWTIENAEEEPVSEEIIGTIDTSTSFFARYLENYTLTINEENTEELFVWASLNLSIMVELFPGTPLPSEYDITLTNLVGEFTVGPLGE